MMTDPDRDAAAFSTPGMESTRGQSHRRLMRPALIRRNLVRNVRRDKTTCVTSEAAAVGELRVMQGDMRRRLSVSQEARTMPFIRRSAQRGQRRRW